MKRFVGKLTLHALAIALVIGGTSPLLAQSRERVKFASGNDNASLQESVKGNDYRDYMLGAEAGQTMSVSLITKGIAYFNILPPGSTGEAIYNSSVSGNDATVKLESDGDYTIRVYLMGNDKDAGKTVKYTLSMTIM